MESFALRPSARVRLPPASGRERRSCSSEAATRLRARPPPHARCHEWPRSRTAPPTIPRPKRGGAIADAPVGFSWAEPELIDGSAYLWIAGENGRPNAPSAFLRTGSTRTAGSSSICRPAIWVGTRSSPRTTGSSPTRTTTPTASGRTTSSRPDDHLEELPDDPFDDPYSRELAWDGSRLLLFDHRERDESSEAPCAGQPSTSSGTSGNSSMIPRPRSRTCPSARRGRRRRRSRRQQRPTAARPRSWPATTSSSSSARNGASPRAGCTRGPGFGLLVSSSVHHFFTASLPFRYPRVPVRRAESRQRAEGAHHRGRRRHRGGHVTTPHHGRLRPAVGEQGGVGPRAPSLSGRTCASSTSCFPASTAGS